MPNIKILFFYILLTFLLSSDNKEVPAYELFLNGEYEFINNNFNAAEYNFNQALINFPESSVLLESLVEIKLYQGDYASAAGYLEKIMSLAPINWDNGLQLIQIYKLNNELEKIENVIDSLTISYPNNIELLFIEAEVKYYQKDYPRVFKIYKTLLLNDIHNEGIINKILILGITTGNEVFAINILEEIEKVYKSIPIYDALIELSYNINDYKGAIYYLEKFLEMDSTSDKQKIRLGKLYIIDEQYELSVSILEPIYKNNNKSYDLLKSLLIGYSMLGSVSQQENIANDLINEHSEELIGYEALALIHIISKDEVAALEVLNSCINKFPNEISCHKSLANLYEKQKNYKQAIKYYNNVLDYKPHDVSVKYSLAVMYEKSDNIFSSDSLFNNLIEHSNGSAAIYNDYAYLISNRKNISNHELKDALKIAEKALDLEPDNSSFLDTIGWIYYKMGLYKKAEKYLLKSLEYDNDNPIILEHLGDVYVSLNDSKEALLLYQKALQNDMDNNLIKNKINEINEK